MFFTHIFEFTEVFKFELTQQCENFAFGSPGFFSLDPKTFSCLVHSQLNLIYLCLHKMRAFWSSKSWLSGVFGELNGKFLSEIFHSLQKYFRVWISGQGWDGWWEKNQSLKIPFNHQWLSSWLLTWYSMTNTRIRMYNQIAGNLR